MKFLTLKRLALFSLIFGGFLVLVYVLQTYFAVWRGEFLPFSRLRRPPSPEEPIGMLFSPFSLLNIISGIAFLINGFWLLKYSEEKSRRDVRSETYAFFLTGDEKMVFDLLKQAGGDATQKELSVKAGLSTVKTHRILMRLKSKNAIEIHPFGMTNKIILK